MRRRLTLTVLAVTAMVTVAFLIPLGLVVKVVANDRALSVADQEARSLSSVLAVETSPAALSTVLAQLNGNGGGRSATVFLPDGQRIGAHITAPSSELALARRGRAFSASSDGETRVWTPVHLATGVVVGVVTVPNRLLTQGVLRSWLVLAGVGLAVLVLAMALADRLGRSAVRSIEDLDAVTQRLRQGELEARVEPAGPPEIASMGRAVNSLADRILELLALEREEAADLSHRLRTPLAALQLETESLKDEGDRQRMGGAVRALTQNVNNVIVEMRKGRSTPVPEVSDIAATVRDRLAFWSVLAEEQGRAWTADIPDAVVEVGLPAADLAAAVDAVIGNVLAHTPEGTAFAVNLIVSTAYCTLVVDDDGPGLPPGNMRERGHSSGGSTGLGLDIVERTAAMASGGLQLGASKSGGTRVEVRFRRAAA
jgi:signal transduction histidine kinase